MKPSTDVTIFVRYQKKKKKKKKKKKGAANYQRPIVAFLESEEKYPISPISKHFQLTSPTYWAATRYFLTD